MLLSSETSKRIYLALSLNAKEKFIVDVLSLFDESYWTDKGYKLTTNLKYTFFIELTRPPYIYLIALMFPDDIEMNHQNLQEAMNEEHMRVQELTIWEYLNSEDKRARVDEFLERTEDAEVYSLVHEVYQMYLDRDR